MSRRWPFLIPLLSMTAGMTLSVRNGCFGDLNTVTAVFVCLVLASFLPGSRLFFAFIALFCFVWGMSALSPWLSPERSPHSVRLKASGRPVTIEGVIAGRPVVAPEGSRVVVRVERIYTEHNVEPASGSVLLAVGGSDVPYLRGDLIRFVSRISVPTRLGVPGEFDYPRYLAFQGISATCRVASAEDIVLMRAAAVESWQRTVDLAARELGDTIRRAIPDERVSSVLTALLIGDQRRIPRDLADAYTRAGVNHILSISGFHIGIIAAFITYLLVWLLTRFEYVALRLNARRSALFIAVPAMLGYLVLTGSAPATARSVIMLAVCAVALFSEREHDAINVLLLAAFLLVAINPPTLFDVSFQLSFLSLWGILIAVPPVAKLSASVQSIWGRSVILFVAASAAASCATLLPVLHAFKVASFNGILTNFIIVPLLGYGAVLSGFISLPLVSLLPSCAHYLLWPAAKLVAVSNQFVIWCNALPVLRFYGITAGDLLFFLLLMITLTFIGNRRFRMVAGVALPACAVVLHMYAAYAADGRLHVTMLSVGQAESMLVRLPDGSTLLVDGGGYLHETGHDFGQRLLAPALGVLNVRRIDRMIATHDHPDHSGGLPFVIGAFEVGEFWSGRDVSADVRRELARKQVPGRTLAAGDVITLPGPVIMTVLSPPRSSRHIPESDEASVNERSLVFRLRYGSFSMIFCADAGFEAEQRMLAEQTELQSTVLKVGHHGSRYSTSEQFLDRVQPEVALISAGAGNSFGLPAPRTVALLGDRHIPVYRTDRDGTIELVSDGTSWSVSTPYRGE